MLLTLNNQNVESINGSLVAANLTASTFIKCDADKKIVTYGSTISPADLTNYPSDANKYLAGDGSWNVISDSIGTANYVAVYNGSGTLFEEQYLSGVRGGLGHDFITSFANGNKLVSVDSSGEGYQVALLADSNVASNAGVARSKLASGTAGEFLLNDGSGVMSSTNLVKYDGTHVVVASPVYFGTNKHTSLLTFDQHTSDATSTALATLTLANNTAYYLKFTVLGVDSSADPIQSLLNKGNVKINCGSTGTVSFDSQPTEHLLNVDAGLAGAVVTLASSGANNLTVSVQGLASHNIEWTCKLKMLNMAQIIV